MPKDATVYLVHCVDTEGPLYESLEATFERLSLIFGIHLPPSRQMLSKLQNCEIDLGGHEKAVAQAMAPHLLAYNDTWDKIDAMLERIGSHDFRYALPDSFGNEWVYSWHCLDHVGYLVNPRRRDIGYHNIFDHYRQYINETQSRDELQWHFHPSHYSLAAHQSATFYFRDTKFFDILARRIIDRAWFPSVSRAGFHSERPDSHWLLEQWIPFDLSNQAGDDSGDQPDLSQGRFGDWRRAPSDWSVYRPDHDDYQIPGNCRRHIGRCLNVGTRHRLLDENEVRKGFEYAQREGAALLAFTDHDFRDIGKDVEYVRYLLQKVIPDFPTVSFRYCTAREAFNHVLFGAFESPPNNILSFTLEAGTDESTRLLRVRSTEAIFGPQPFLAIRTLNGDYYYENFDFQEPFHSWTYVFDELTFPWKIVDCIGMATNDQRGFPHILRISADEHREASQTVGPFQPGRPTAAQD